MSIHTFNTKNMIHFLNWLHAQQKVQSSKYISRLGINRKCLRSLLSLSSVTAVARCEMTETCQLSSRQLSLPRSLCDPNRGPDITVSLPGGKPNTGPISNLVFHKIWQLVSDDKPTEIFSPPGNLWQYNSTHTH